MKVLKYWNSDEVGANSLFELNKEKKTITLGLESIKDFSNISPTKKYEFFEGLWEYDVVETFISLEGKNYLEINLSTTGAWWAATFNDHRKRDNKKPKVELIDVEISANKVVGNFSYQDLELKNEFNVCAIINNKFLSLNSVDKKVDFHLRELRSTEK